jgi:release factor glutamine methyltransferase
VGLDVSDAALEVARRNAVRHGVQERLSLILSDCFEALDCGDTRFDMIVSNPPYVAEEALGGLQREVRDFEPRVALTPGGDGLRLIRRLLGDAAPLLQSNGHLLMEIGFDQHEAVRTLIDPQIWELFAIHRDLQGIPRTVALRKRGGR